MSKSDGIRLEKKLFQLADALSGCFWLPTAAEDRARLQILAWRYWKQVKRQKRVLWLSYLLRLLLTCPPLFGEPAGFEWMMQQVRWELEFRKYNPSADKDFWDALKMVKGKMRRGRPSDKGRDLDRAYSVGDLMRERGYNKTQAVERLTGLLSARSDEGKEDVSAVWKSLERFEAEQAQRRRVLRPFQHDDDEFFEVQSGGSRVIGQDSQKRTKAKPSVAPKDKLTKRKL
ncbi:MAG TPA: hypothetical protein VIW48_05840 [Nitrospiraceae bacterium]